MPQSPWERPRHFARTAGRVRVGDILKSGEYHRAEFCVLLLHIYAYNLANLVTPLTNKAGSTILPSHQYTYDQSGNRMTLVSSGPEAYTVKYDYDLDNRLTRETKTAGSNTYRTGYHYDPNGNTLAVVPAMLSGAPATGVPSLSLDDGLGSATLMEYDGLNRLVRTETGDTLAEYTYRPDGLRHNKVVDGVTTTHVWDGASMVLELENGAISNQYIRGIGLIAANLGGASEYYIFNAHGDVTGLANTNGALVQVHDYDAFGNEKTPDAADSNPFRYCGEYYDSSSGTYYLRNRYYSPGTGRFTQEDPAQAGLNWYTYCGNSPMMWTDPSGLDAILINKHLEGGEWYKDIGNAVGIEHMGGFFQDEDDAWWYFSWEDTVKYKQVDDESIFDSMDSMNAWIIDNEMLSGENPYMTSVYVKGDFTASNNAAAKLFEIYDQSSKTGNANGLPNGNYNVMSNNCGQVAMRLLSMGTLPDGTNVGSYIAGRGYYTTGELPDIHMNNMQNIFYNKAHNFTGFESAMQTQRAKYEGKNDFIQWWYSDLKNNINTIAP